MDQKLVGINQAYDDDASCPPTEQNNRIRHSEIPFSDDIEELLDCEA